jgi:hypothetical protein
VENSAWLRVAVGPWMRTALGPVREAGDSVEDARFWQTEMARRGGCLVGG